MKKGYRAMDKTKVIWLDIGTPLAQEHRSLFGAASWFWWKIMRRFVAGNLLSRGKAIQISYILHTFSLRNKIQLAEDRFHFSFVEPNINLISNNAFFNNRELFCLALGANKKRVITIGELFHPPGDNLSQGSSIYFEGKGYKDFESFICCPIMDAKEFMARYKAYLDKRYRDYVVILRLNCEGAEDDAIYACKDVFGSSFKKIFGSLKDVKAVKGEADNILLQSFMKKNELTFTEFSGDVTSWGSAFAGIKDLISEFD